MILQIEDWKFDLDLASTMDYSANEAAEHCECGYCRNFYAAVDRVYPGLRPFLAQFGLNIEAPDEQLPYDFQGKMYYDSTYLVFGKILQQGKDAIYLDQVEIRPVAEWNLDIEVQRQQPSFALEVNSVVLPWVLETPMKDTVSPANRPSFLKRMWRRLLSRESEGEYRS